MNALRSVLLFTFSCLIATGSVLAQDSEMASAQKPVITERILNQMNQKTTSVNSAIEKQTTRYLKRLAKKEQRMRDRFFKVDSTAAKKLFDGAADKYNKLATAMQQAPMEKIRRLKGQYLPGLDSLQGSLNFLDKNKDLLPASKGAADKLQASLGQVNQLQSRLGQTEQITAFLKERKQQIGEALKKYANLPKGLSRGYGDFNKELFYYQAQVNSYKELLHDPVKMQQQALTLLNKLPAFQEFMKKNSLLAGLFSVPANYGTPQALAGFQTRDQVQQLIGNQIAAGGSGAMGAVQQQLQSAQGQLSQLKNKINQLGGGSGDIDMPNFKPNQEKTKNWKDRIEWGTNLQTTRSNTFFVTTSDIGLSAAYKLSDKSSIGIGGAYRLGLGKDIRHVAFTSEGISLRSFLEAKLIGNFWITGGAEMNYRNRFKNFKVLEDYSAWQQSALVGISKKYQVSKKVTGDAQILYDALWKTQIPRGQPVVFRIGYRLK